MAKKRPETNCKERQSPRRDPKFHQEVRLAGEGRSTIAPFTIFRAGCDFISDLILKRISLAQIYSLLSLQIGYLIYTPAVVIYLFSLWGGLSRDNFFRLWVFIELNLLTFVFLIFLRGRNMPGVELKYFLLQRLASGGFLLSYLALLSQNHTLFELSLFGSILLKLAAAPAHG